MLPVLFFAGLVSFIIERLNELLLVKYLDGTKLENYIEVIAFSVGTIFALLLGVDFVTPFAGELGISLTVPEAGTVLSSLAVGGGSNVIHDVVSYIQAKKDNAQSNREGGFRTWHIVN